MMKKILPSCLLAFMLFAVLGAPISAQTETTTPDEPGTDALRFNPEILITEPITRDLIAAGGTININEAVNKDATVAGGTINFNAPVAGDIRAFGGTIIISNSVGGDIVVGGGTVRIIGAVAGDVRLLGGNVEINSTVGGNVAASGGSLSFGPESVIAGSVVAKAGRVEFHGKIMGAADIHVPSGENLQLAEGARVEGSLTYRAPSSANINEAQVAGGVEFVNTPKAAPRGSSLLWFFRIISLFGMLVAGLVLIAAFPSHIKSAVAASIKNPFTDILWGIVSLFAIPVLVLFLMATIIGFPLALGLAALYLIGLYAGKIMVGVVLGMYIFGAIKGRAYTSAASLFAVLVVGVLALWLITGIPQVGWIIGLASVIWGLGIIVRLVTDAFKKRREA